MPSRNPLESRFDTFRWVIGEGVVIAGVFLFWAGAVFAIRTGLLILLRVAELVGMNPLFAASVRRTDLFEQAVVLVTGATVTLYVLVRAGTILVDRYRQAER